MKKILLLIIALGVSEFGFTQVGINTTSPNAQLDIRSSNQVTPANTDGMLIPKIDAFPLVNPTAAQQGMMVYLTTVTAGKQPGFYYWDNTGTPQWKGFGGNAGWEILGNSGTNPSLNFIGTTDANDVVFRRDNVISGKIGMANTSFGRSSLNPLNSGIYNSTFGLSSLTNNTSGNSNSAFGNYALTNNSTGNSNTGFGSNVMYSNSTGQNNTAVGSSAMELNSLGNNNTSLGYYSIYNNTLGNNNLALGYESLFLNTLGNNNTAIGYQSGNTITTGGNNITLGANANVPLPAGSNQLSIGNVIYGAAMNTSAFARIGINEPSPNAKLQVNASNQANPTSTDGIIIPKIDAFPFINPSSSQNGMMVFLTTPANKSGFYYWDNPTTTWKGIGANSGWGLTGNAGTNSGTNFIGTTDNVDLVFKRSNQLAGKISSFNLSLGINALSGLLTGTNNSAYGHLALEKNTGGSNNIAIGVASLNNNSIGYANLAIGSQALELNNSATQNIAIGNNALQNQNFANGNLVYETNNIAIGVEALNKNNPTTTANGKNNTAIGTFALTSNTIGTENTASGFQSLYSNTTGGNNTATGVNALYSNTTGYYNVANGESALYSNTTGYSNTATGSDALSSNTTGYSNTATGSYALSSNTTGFENTASGRYALFSSTSGVYNAAFGFDALRSGGGNFNTANGHSALRNNSGSDNTATGFEALKNNNGSYNTAYGFGALLSNNGNNNTAAGLNALRSNFGNDNTAIGVASLAFNATGQENVAMGMKAMNRNSIGSYNTALGYSALNGVLGNDIGNYNSATGHSSLFNMGGNENTANGVNAMRNATTGNYNTVVGTNSLYTNTGSSNNTTLGHSTLFSNVSGSGNVAIGYQAGYNELGSNRLYIENSSSAIPLMYGEFDNDLIRINGKTEGIYTQLTANGDGQSSIYGYRTRDSQNDGTSYSRTGTNKATSGYNLWGDLYTFGVTGHSDNDFTRTGGVLGSVTGGTYWSSLGYKNSAATTYGVYGTAALATGTGRSAQSQSAFGIGGGFYGDIIGSWSKGNVIGTISSGSLFASYNSGDEYTAGRQVEIVPTATGKKALYTVTSTESVVYKKGKIALQQGSAHVAFDADYAQLLGDTPIVTTTPMGQCNGIYIESSDKTGFTIKELNNGTSNVIVSWIAVGDRIDAGRPLSPDVMAQDFDDNINQVMFNENNKDGNAKAIWSEGKTIRFGQLPESLIEKPVKNEDKK